METNKLPYNVNAERAIFSIILNGNGENFLNIADRLTPSDFFFSTHQDIWKAMSNLYAKGQNIDVVSIKSELQKIDVDPRPAIGDLIKCYEDVSFESNLEKFVDEVRNKSILRNLIGLTNRYSEEARFEDAESEKLLGNIEKDVVELSDTLKDNRPIDSEGILNEIKIDMVKGAESGWKGYDTGFKWLDEQTGGFIPTQVWIVGAYTGLGKTFFLLQMVLNILRKGANVMLFSTEMDRKMNMLRLLGNLAGLGTIKMLKRLLDDDELKRMEKAEVEMCKYKESLAIYDNVYSVEDIRLKVKKRKLREGVDVVFIDFIQNLRGAENIYERMSNAAIALQQLAQELNITIVIASQVAQTSAGWSSKEAIEYKGAGEIAAIADVALWINKVEDDKSARKVIIRKIRHGIPGHIIVRISFPSGRIIDMDESSENGGVDDVKGQL